MPFEKYKHVLYTNNVFTMLYNKKQMEGEKTVILQQKPDFQRAVRKKISKTFITIIHTNT